MTWYYFSKEVNNLKNQIMNPKDLMYSQRRFSFLHLVSFVVFLCMVVYGGYVFMSKSGLDADIADTDSQIADLEEQISSLEAQSLDEVTIAQKVINSVEGSEIVWSDVVSGLLAVTPLDIYYVSYAGNEDGSVTINGLGDTYISISGLIDAISEENSFADVFVPSTALSASETGEMATFSLNFSYADDSVSVEEDNVEVDVPVGDDGTVAAQ